MDTTNIHIHDRSHSRLGTCTSITMTNKTNIMVSPPPVTLVTNPIRFRVYVKDKMFLFF